MTINVVKRRPGVDEIAFGLLCPRDLFEHKNEIYLKVSPLTKRGNAVHLHYAEIVHFPATDMVRRLTSLSELVVDYFVDEEQAEMEKEGNCDDTHWSK